MLFIDHAAGIIITNGCPCRKGAVPWPPFHHLLWPVLQDSEPRDYAQEDGTELLEFSQFIDFIAARIMNIYVAKKPC